MSIQVLRCKICQEVLPEPPIIIGEPIEKRQTLCLELIADHFRKKSMAECKNQLDRTKPHVAADQQMSVSIRQVGVYLTMGTFDLPPYLEEVREKLRAFINAATAPTLATAPAAEPSRIIQEGL